MAERQWSLEQWKQWGRAKSRLATNVARENGALKERVRLLITTLNLLSEEKLKDVSPKYDVPPDEKTKDNFEACPENIRVAREAPCANLEMEESVADRLMTLGSTSVPQKDESKGELDNQCERPVQETLAVLSDG